MVVEIDGPVHEIQVEYDRERDEILKELGYQVLRFNNEAVFEEIEEVLAEISKSF